MVKACLSFIKRSPFRQFPSPSGLGVGKAGGNHGSNYSECIDCIRNCSNFNPYINSTTVHQILIKACLSQYVCLTSGM